MSAIFESIMEAFKEIGEIENNPELSNDASKCLASVSESKEEKQMSEIRKVNLREELIRLDKENFDSTIVLSDWYDSVCEDLTLDEKKFLIKESLNNNRADIQRVLSNKLKSLSEEYSTTVIEDVGVDGDDVERQLAKGDVVNASGIIYSHDSDGEYEDDFKFSYNAKSGEVKITEINPLFTKEELDEVIEILKDNIETNFVSSHKNTITESDEEDDAYKEIQKTKIIDIWNIEDGDKVQQVVATYCWLQGEEVTEQMQEWIEDLRNNQEDFDELKVMFWNV